MADSIQAEWIIEEYTIIFLSEVWLIAPKTPMAHDE